MFLGFDCSTQSFSAVLIDFEKRKVVYEKSLPFDREFPKYKTKKGFLPSKDLHVAHAPPLMWAEALDKMFSIMRGDGIDLSRVRAVSGSAQQHGSVYLNDAFPDALLSYEIERALSRKWAPIWMDTSTAKECEEIRSALGGAKRVIEMTGSNTFERFTGPQIRKFYKTEKERYEQTAHIALVSSFLASLLLGKVAPIDFGDGSGMNLMDIRQKKWSQVALDATAPGLEEKLPPLVEPWRILGPVSPYFANKYGMDAQILPWTGDNPSSLIGLGLIEEGQAGISLGTSFTYFADLKEFHVDPKGEAHLMVSPNGDYMPLICFQNGAFAMGELRRLYGIEPSDFFHQISLAPPGNGGRLMLPYFQPEIVPKVLAPKVHRLHLEEIDVPGNCRALVEAQMLSMRLHAEWLRQKPKAIFATGGVSNNGAMLQIMADVHGCTVLRSAVSKSAALGAALRAAHGFFGDRPWKEIVAGFTDPIERIEPNPKTVPVYDKLLREYEAFEKSITRR